MGVVEEVVIKETYVSFNVTLRRDGVTSGAVEKQLIITYSECVCSHSYPAGKAHAPYYHLRLVWLYYILLHYLMKGTIFRGKKVYRT